MYFYSLILSVAFLIHLALAVFVLAKRPTSHLNRLIAAIILGLGTWSFAEIFLLNPGVPKSIAITFANIGAFGWCSFASLFLWFSLIFINGSHRAQRMYPLLLLVPVLFICRQWTGGLIIDLIRQPYGWSGVWSPSIWTDLFDVYFLSFSGLGLCLVFRYGRNVESTIKKKQSTIIVTVGLFSLLLGALLDRVLPRLGVYTVPQLAVFTGLFWTSGLVYAIARYRFLVITPTTASQNIIATMKDFLMLLNPQGRITTVNPSTLDSLGYQEKELKGTPLEKLFDGGNTWNSLRDAIHSGETVGNCSATFVRKTGEKLPVLLSASALKDDARQTAGIVVVARDITARVRAEEQLRTAPNELEIQVQERTAALTQRARQLQIISDVGRRVSAILKLDELLSYVVTTIQQTFSYSYVDIFLIDQGYANLMVSSDPRVEERLEDLRFEVGKEGMIGWVAQSGEPLLANDVSQESHYLPDALLPETKSELTVPLKVEGRVVGVLDLQDNRLNAFSEDNIFVLETLGHQVAIAIENARLFQESQRRTEEMTALREVSLATLSSLDQDQVFETMLDQIGKFIDYASASIKIISPDGWEKMIAGRGPTIHEQIMWDGFDVKENKLVQEMKETRQPVVVHNTHTDERYQRVGNWEAFHSWVGAPLFVRGDLIGHLDLEITSPGFYDENTIQLLGDFARTAAIALENAELYDKARQHAEEMASLHKIGLTTTSTLDLDEVLKLIYEQVNQLMKPDTFYIALYHEQKEEINFEIYVEKGQDLGKFSGKLEEGGLTSWIIQSNQPLLVRNTAKESWPIEPLVTGEIAPEMSYLGVPLLAKGKVIGVISVESFRPYTYNEEDQYFLTAVADQAAVAIENARLFEEAHRRAEQMAIVNRIARATSATLHLDDLMETVYREIAPIFQGDAFFIALYDEETDELDFRFLVDEGVRGYPGRIPLGGLSSVVVTEKKPLIIREFEQERDRLPAPLLMGTDKLPASWLGVPMLIGERVIGVINVQSYLPRTWGEDDELLLCTIADQVAVALENAHLFEEAQHRAEEMAVLNELGQVLTARLNVEEVLVEAYHQASRLVDTTNFYIGLYDGEKDEVSFPFSVSESEIDNQITVMSASQGITGYIIRNRTSVLLGENGLDWQEEKGVETFGQEAPSWLGVPLMIGDRVVGVMVVQSYTTPNLYDEHDRDLLTAIASPTAIALENAQLFEAAQRELAERERTEKALRESEGRFRRLYDSNTLGIVYWDSSDRLVDANDAFLDIIGYTRQDLLTGNLHLQDITPPEYHHLDEKGFEELRKTGACSPFEKEYVRKDGTRVSVLIGGAFLESKGDIGVSYVIDVTERKQMEKALQESEERFALAVQGANDGIWDWDIQKNLLYWSPRMKELLGYADDELDVDFDTFEVTLHPDDRERTKATMEARLKDGQLYGADHRLRTKSGEFRWFHVRGQVVFDEAGNPVRMIGSTADITGRKQAEERLHRTLEGVIEALGQTTETRDLYTAGHQKRVTQLACTIAKEMELCEEHIEGIRIAGLVHDIGKMAIPAEILSKPSQLSEMEYGLIKAHPKTAYDVIKTIEFPWPAAQIVLQHHERMDGSGYPQGLKGEEIMLEARILAVADVVEAMASHRPYRPALGIDRALEEIAQNKSTLYDAVVVDTCLRLFDEKRFSFEGEPPPDRI